MKKLFTLGALGLLASFGAQAQITVDGRINTTEVGSGINKYQSMGAYTGAHGYGPWGLKEAFIGEDANFIYLGIHGSVEQNGNSLYVFFSAPNQTPVAACSALTALGQTTAGENTAFTGFNHLLEIPVSAGLALRIPAAGAGQVELGDYRAATQGTQILGALTTDGTSSDYVNGAIRAAYVAPPTDITDNTNQAWELRFAKAAYNLTNGTDLKLFVLMGNQAGDYLSSDYIPMTTDAAIVGTNLNQNVDFCTNVGGSQAVTYRVGSGIVNGLKKINAGSLDFTVAPNPTNGSASVINFKLDNPETASLTVTDLLGRQVAVLTNGTLAAGQQRFELPTSSLAAGQYIVKLQLGNRVATQKLSVL